MTSSSVLKASNRFRTPSKSRVVFGLLGLVRGFTSSNSSGARSEDIIEASQIFNDVTATGD